MTVFLGPYHAVYRHNAGRRLCIFHQRRTKTPDPEGTSWVRGRGNGSGFGVVASDPCDGNVGRHGRMAFIPPVAGFLLGIAFLLLLDRIIPHLHIGCEESEGAKMLFEAFYYAGYAGSSDAQYPGRDLQRRGICRSCHR